MGFKVIRDFIEKDSKDKAVGIESAKPSNFWQSHMNVDPDSDVYEYNGGKIKIRLRDDDNNVYYHLYVDDIEFSCELASDWGTGYAGAVHLDLHIDDYKKYIGTPKYEKYISKCGKWYSYM